MLNMSDFVIVLVVLRVLTCRLTADTWL